MTILPRDFMAVSVVIPSYNCAAFLGEALDSVFAQSLPADEVIVVDDCSPDDGIEIARRAGAICLRTPVNSGQAAARNAGIRAARGDLVAFLDSDDRWEPNHLATLVPMLDRYKTAAVAYSRARHFGEESRESPAFLPPDQPMCVFWTLLRFNPVPVLTAVARREAVLAAGGFDESFRYSEDYDLWLRIGWRHPFVCSSEVTAGYRTHAQQMTAAPSVRMLRSWWRARVKAIDVVRREGTAEDLARTSRELRAAWEDDLRWAWWQRDRELLDGALDQSAAVPESNAQRRQWQVRRALWPVWSAVRGTWGVLPRAWRDALRAPLRPLFNAP